MMEQSQGGAESSVIPVIVVAMTRPATLARGRRCGFLQKPADNAELLAAIRRTLVRCTSSIILNTQIAS